nr:MAG TPA: hypothetical protein [Caudoviricetes sp.]
MRAWRGRPYGGGYRPSEMLTRPAARQARRLG